MLGELSGTLHVFEWDGRYAPGWPQVIPGEFAVFAAAKDVDVDGYDELAWAAFRLHLFDRGGVELPGWPYSLLPKEGFAGCCLPIMASFGPGASADILASGGAGTLTLLDRGGQIQAGWPVSTTGKGKAAVGDITGDGYSEIVTLEARDALIYAFDRQGNSLPGFPVSFPATNTRDVTLGDLDGDGAQEIIFPAFVPELRSYAVFVLPGRPPFSFPGWPQRTLVTNRGVALGDVDGDGQLELAVATTNSGTTLNGFVHLWEADGSDVPGWPKEVANTSFSGQVMLADADGDGHADVVAAGTRVVGVAGVIYAWRASGELLPGYPMVISRPITLGGPTIADIDGDGLAELNIMSDTGLFARLPTRVHWFDLGVPYRPEAMEWPTRAHDWARTGSYSPPVERRPMEVGIKPELLGADGPAPPLTVIVRIPPEHDQRPTSLRLVALDGNRLATPLEGELRSQAVSTTGPGARLRVFAFDGNAIGGLLGRPGRHTLTFRTEVFGGLGGIQFEGEGELVLAE